MFIESEVLGPSSDTYVYYLNEDTLSRLLYIFYQPIHYDRVYGWVLFAI